MDQKLSLEEWFQLANLLGRAARELGSMPPDSVPGHQDQIAVMEQAQNVLAWQLRIRQTEIDQRFAQAFDDIRSSRADEDEYEGDDEAPLQAEQIPSRRKKKRRLRRSQ